MWLDNAYDLYEFIYISGSAILSGRLGFISIFGGNSFEVNYQTYDNRTAGIRVKYPLELEHA
jgi:hypothetical protein